MTEIANQAIGRRSFLKGLALAGVGAAGVASLGGCATPVKRHRETAARLSTSPKPSTGTASMTS